MYQRIALSIVGLIGLVIGYILIVTPEGATSPAVAYAATKPATPHLIYVGQEEVQYGILSEETLAQRQIISLPDWQAAKTVAAAKPVDAIFTDTEQLLSMTEDEKNWFQSLLSSGVVVVGLGVDLNQFAEFFGTDTLRSPGEANVPIGLDGAYMIYGQILGEPEEVARMEDNNWLASSLRGEDVHGLNIYAPLVTSAGTARIALDSTRGVEDLFKSLDSSIDGAYRTRAQYKMTTDNFVQEGQ